MTIIVYGVIVWFKRIIKIVILLAVKTDLLILIMWEHIFIIAASICAVIDDVGPWVVLILASMHDLLVWCHDAGAVFEAHHILLTQPISVLLKTRVILYLAIFLFFRRWLHF